MASFLVLTDSQLAVNKFFTAFKARALRDNLQAAFEGNAPFQLDQGAISPAPYDQQGALASIPTTGGVFSVTSLTDNVGASLGPITLIYSRGDVDLSGSHTFTCDYFQDPHPGDLTGTDECLAQLTQAMRGIDAQDLTGAGSPSGANAGSSVGNAGGTSRGFGATLMANFWRHLRPLVGGAAIWGGGSSQGEYDNKGGGSLVIFVEGDLDLEDCTIEAFGQGGGATNIRGGGGGGSIILIATGTITETNCTLDASGGDGGSVSGSDGGGGGYIARVASAFTGTATTDVGGGVASGTGTNGADGLAEKYTLTAARIRSLVNALR